MEHDTLERYKLIFEAHKHASDFREKIVRGWLLTYAALAVALGWSQGKPETIGVSWIFSAMAVFLTALMWVADFRNRDALTRSKAAGEAIEERIEIPPKERFFAGLTPARLTHSLAVDIFAGLMIAASARGTVILAKSGGQLRPLFPVVVCWGIAGGLVAGIASSLRTSHKKRKGRST
jgi:hypothetical protein